MESDFIVSCVFWIQVFKSVGGENVQQIIHA